MLTYVNRPDGRVSVLAGPLTDPHLIADRRPTTNSRGAVMSLERLKRMISEGYGQGHGEAYWPWIRIRRMLSGRLSNLYALSNPMYARALHLLSGLEVQAAVLLCWLGATHIREQFPAWPETHVHPLYGSELALAAHRHTVPGLLDIAHQARIKHGTYPGTRIPFVATIDLAVQPPSDRQPSLILIPVKPASERDGVGRRANRVRERLELQRLYAQEVKARYVEYTDATCPRLLTSQLIAFRPRNSELGHLRRADELHRFAEHFNARHRELCLSAARKHAMQSIGLSDVRRSHSLFWTASWLGLINLDYSKPIQMLKPIWTDDAGRKEVLATAFFGPRSSS